MKPQPTVRISKRLYDSRYLMILFLPTLVSFLLFQYAPMFGIVVAFKDYNVFKGLFASKWVGMKYFKILFFENPDFLLLLRNTFLLGFYSLIFGFPAPIMLSLLLNEIRAQRFKKLVQTVSYLPHFISTVIICSMIINFLSPSDGMVNVLIKKLGYEHIYFMAKSHLFRPIYIISGIWQGIGWGTIIYLAAISSINPSLYESAELDGAGRWRKMWNITLPGITPLITLLLILNIGSLLSTSFEKVLLLYQPLTYETADIFSTYTYRVGIQQGNFSYGTAIGLFNGVVSFILIIMANWGARKINQYNLW